MSGLTSLEELRTFESEEEIRDLPGFKEGNSVSLTNYRKIIGDYRFAEKLRCCLAAKAGGLCNTPHNYGFVVELADASVSIIGNKCGSDRFDAQSALSRDRTTFINQKKRRDLQRRIAELLGGKADALEQVRTVNESVTALDRRLRLLLDRFGTKCSNQLRILSHGGTGRVGVTGVKIRRGEFEGETLIERDRLSIHVGTLQGTAVFRGDQMRSIKDDLRKVALAFPQGEALGDDAKTSVVERIAGQIADLPRVIDSAQRLLDAEQAFLNSDWSALPFLVRDKSDRTKLARMVIEHAGSPGGSDKAKLWLSGFEAELRSRNGVDKLEINY